jgi:tRNA dimethylallyltransferase
MPETAKNIVVVCGPTASGKTALAVRIARDIDGEILSADSRQVYRGMDIGTGKDLAEYSAHGPAVPYHLIDITDPQQVYTVFHYQQDCYAAIEGVWSRRRIPVLAGGTGLYIEAVLRHYRIANVPEDEGLRGNLTKLDKGDLVEKLHALNPELLAATDCSSKKRVVRGIEIAEYGRAHAIEWGRPDPPRLKPLVLCVRWERQALHYRIEERLKKRLDQGMVDEVRRLLATGITRERFALFGMEYKHVARYLAGERTYEVMVEELKKDIFALAKRQETYFRGMERRGVEIQWVENGEYEKAREIIQRQQIESAHLGASPSRLRDGAGSPLGYPPVGLNR